MSPILTHPPMSVLPRRLFSVDTSVFFLSVSKPNSQKVNFRSNATPIHVTIVLFFGCFFLETCLFSTANNLMRIIVCSHFYMLTNSGASFLFLYSADTHPKYTVTSSVFIKSKQLRLFCLILYFCIQLLRSSFLIDSMNLYIYYIYII